MTRGMRGDNTLTTIFERDGYRLNRCASCGYEEIIRGGTRMLVLPPQECIQRDHYTNPQPETPPSTTAHTLIRHPVKSPELRGSCTCGHVWNLEGPLGCTGKSSCPSCPLHRDSYDVQIMEPVEGSNYTITRTIVPLPRICPTCSGNCTPTYDHTTHPLLAPKLIGWTCIECRNFTQP